MKRNGKNFIKIIYEMDKLLLKIRAFDYTFFNIPKANYILY